VTMFCTPSVKEFWKPAFLARKRTPRIESGLSSDGTLEQPRLGVVIYFLTYALPQTLRL
jgi:hypothetical protein